MAKNSDFWQKKRSHFEQKYRSEFSMQGYDSNVFFATYASYSFPKSFFCICAHIRHISGPICIFSPTQKNSKFNQILYNLSVRLLRACFATFFLQNLRKIIYKKICNTTFALFFSFEPQNEKEKKSHS